MKNKIYKINTHSFVDLITNSSTEIYIQANDKTIEYIKKLVDNILEAGGSSLHCDDLFDISLDKEKLLKGYNYDDEKITAEEFYEKTMENGTNCNVYLVVKSKDQNNEAAKLVAGVLASLTNLFGMHAEYNG